MVTSMAGAIAAGFPPFTPRLSSPSTKLLRPLPKKAVKVVYQSSFDRTGGSKEGRLEKKLQVDRNPLELDRFGPGVDEEGDCEVSVSTEDYFKQVAALVKSTGDRGGPRWFCPVECGRPVLKAAPILMYLPGIDGMGLGLVKQHRKLGRIFETWCLHIPVMDRTPFAELVTSVETIIRTEHNRSPRRPIYLVGESFGGCLALVLASRNVHLDLVLILANPATSFNISVLRMLGTTQLKLLVSLLESTLSKPLGDSTGAFFCIIESALGQLQSMKGLLEGLRSFSSYYSVIADSFPIHTFLWRMEMLKHACDEANSCLDGIRAQTLVLTSGLDPLLPSLEEGERLRGMMLNCEIRKFYDKGHFLFLVG